MLSALVFCLCSTLMHIGVFCYHSFCFLDLHLERRKFMMHELFCFVVWFKVEFMSLVIWAGGRWLDKWDFDCRTEIKSSTTQISDWWYVNHYWLFIRQSHRILRSISERVYDVDYTSLEWELFLETINLASVFILDFLYLWRQLI